MLRSTRESILWVILIVVIVFAVALRVEASPFPEADACKAKRVTERVDGVTTVRCVTPPESAPTPIKVRITYGRALPRDYAECVVVPTTEAGKMEFRCVALVPR
jgi:hypothetical protein